MDARRALLWVGVVVAAGVAGYVATCALYPAPLMVGEVTVPALRGLAREDALGQLTALGLRGREAEALADPLTPRGTVSWQTPPAATVVPEGTIVRIGVSSGAPIVEVPDVTDFDLGLARRVLEAAGLRLEAVDSVRSTEPLGAVVRTRPEARTPVRAGSDVQATVSRGLEPAPTRRP